MIPKVTHLGLKDEIKSYGLEEMKKTNKQTNDRKQNPKGN